MTEKRSGIADWWMRQPEILQRGIMGAGALVGGLAVNEGYKAIKDSIGKSRGYSAMIQSNPALAKMDRAKTQQLYSTLHHLSPTMATDPLIAGSFVKRMHGMEEYLDPKTVLDIASVEERASKSRADLSEPVRAIFQGRTPSPGLFGPQS